MKIPKKLKIGGHIYEVHLKKDGDVLFFDKSGGQTAHKKHIIEIDIGLVQSEKEATLLHEIFHALNAQWSENEIMHALMEATSQQLYQVLKDNKMLK